LSQELSVSADHLRQVVPSREGRTGALDHDRPSVAPRGHLVRFHADHERLRAAVIGSGSIGAVLANQTDNSVCQWLPLPSYLAAHGMRVLAFDYGSGDDSTGYREQPGTCVHMRSGASC
jgi:hypothetical protein